MNIDYFFFDFPITFCHVIRADSGLCPAGWGRRYSVMPSFIGWALAKSWHCAMLNSFGPREMRL